MLAGELIDRTKHIRLAHRSIFIPNTAPSNQRNSLLRAKTEGAIHFHFPPTSNSYGTTTTLQLKDKKNDCATIFLYACANEISCSSCQLVKFPKAVFRTVITIFVASSITGMLSLHAETLILSRLTRTNICSLPRRVMITHSGIYECYINARAVVVICSSLHLLPTYSAKYNII